jgi:aminoglycoside 6'-N-acetyltransferase
VALTLPIRTARLTLRRFRDDDRERFLEYRRDPNVARFQGWDASYPDALADQFFAEMTSAPPWRVGSWFQIAIDRGGTLVGDIGIHAGETSAEIGYTLHRDSQGHGYASEAVAAVVRVLPVDEVVAWTDVANVASIRLLERLGFERADEPVDGEWAYRLAIAGHSTRGP